MENRRANAIVVGAGASGGIVAKEVSEAGLSVVLFERGKRYGVGDYNHDELLSEYSVPPAYGPSVYENPRTFRYTDREEARLVYPGVDGDYGKIAGCVGGGTLSYGGASWRFMREDFRMKSTYGPIAGTTVEDWPISYGDLEPCYEKAEYELGVAGEAGADPFAAPRKKPYPLPPLPINPQGEIIKAAGLRLGWHPFPPPFAILAQDCCAAVPRGYRPLRTLTFSRQQPRPVFDNIGTKALRPHTYSLSGSGIMKDRIWAARS